MNNRYEIIIRDDQHLWFLEQNIPVFDVLEWFEPRFITDKSDPSVATVTFQTDLGWSFKAYIEKGKFYISERSTQRPGTRLFISESKLKPGDKIILEKDNATEFKLKSEKKHD